MAVDTFIKCKDLTVDLPVYDQSSRYFKNHLVNFATGGQIKNISNTLNIRALENINLDVNIGERVGILGHNGSGKTTLLRVLSKVYKVNKLNYTSRGKILSLLNVMQGFEQDATGIENIYIRSLYENLRKEEVDSYINSIIKFSELKDFINMPIRIYSTGMMLRLAFSIIVHIPADIVLLDEWLSVGDKNFELKAVKKFNEFLGSKSILVLASHKEDLIDKICNRKIKLQNGKIVYDKIL